MSFSFGSVVNILRFLSLTGKHEALKMLMLTVVWSVYKSFFIIMGIFISFKILVTLQSYSIGSSRNVNIDICLCFGRMPPLRHARGWRKYCEVIVFYYILKMYLNLYCVMWTFNLSRQNYFSSTQKSILLLFRSITGDDWNKIMHDYMLRSPFCSSSRSYWNKDCDVEGEKKDDSSCATALVIYFCSFYVIIAYIVLNLLVGKTEWCIFVLSC